VCWCVAGPEEDIKPLLEQLKAEGVFVRELDTRGLAFHSPVLQPHLGELKEGEQQRFSLSVTLRTHIQNGVHAQHDCLWCRPICRHCLTAVL
jgi:hypothetical protein